MPMCPAVWSGTMRVFWMLTEPKSIMKPWGESSLTGRSRTGACTMTSTLKYLSLVCSVCVCVCVGGGGGGGGELSPYICASASMRENMSVCVWK